MFSVSHIAEVAALLAVAYALGLAVGMFAHRLVLRPAQGDGAAAVTAAPAASAVIADALAVNAPLAAGEGATVPAAAPEPLAPVAEANLPTASAPAEDIGRAGEQPGGEGAGVMAVAETPPLPVAVVAEAVAEPVALPEVVAPVVPQAIGPIVVDDALVPFDTLPAPATIRWYDVPAAPPPSQDDVLAGLASVGSRPSPEGTDSAERGPESAPVVVATVEASSDGRGEVVVPVAVVTPEGAAVETVAEPTVSPPGSAAPVAPEDLIAALSTIAPRGDAPMRDAGTAANSGPADAPVAPAVPDAVAPTPEAAPPVADAVPPVAVDAPVVVVATAVAAEAVQRAVAAAEAVALSMATPVAAPVVAKAAPVTVDAAASPAEPAAAPPTDSAPVPAQEPAVAPQAPTPPPAPSVAPIVPPVPSNFDDLLTRLTSMAAKARAERDGGRKDPLESGSTPGGTTPRPQMVAGARPARVPGVAWGGLIRGKSASVYTAKAGPLAKTPSTARPGVAPTPTITPVSPASPRVSPPLTPMTSRAPLPATGVAPVASRQEPPLLAPIAPAPVVPPVAVLPVQPVVVEPPVAPMVAAPEPVVDTSAAIPLASRPVESAPEPIREPLPEPVLDTVPEPALELVPEPAPEPVLELTPAPEPEATPQAVAAEPVGEGAEPAPSLSDPSAAARAAAAEQAAAAELSLQAALFETLAAELAVTPTPRGEIVAMPDGSDMAEIHVTPVVEEALEEAEAADLPEAPVAPPDQPEIDEDDAMRAIEGGWSRTRSPAMGGMPDISDLGAAVSAAQIAVETVLARNGIDPGLGAASVRPKGLPKPRNGKRDNLQVIRGVGALDEIALNNLGIFHYDQIAEWDQKTILWLENHAFARGRIGKENWQAQARAALADISDIKRVR